MIEIYPEILSLIVNITLYLKTFESCVHNSNLIALKVENMMSNFKIMISNNENSFQNINCHLNINIGISS